MEINMTLEGSVSFKENGKTKGYEQVEASFCINFKIESDGDLTASSATKTFQTVVYDYDEVTDDEHPETKIFTISKVLFKGYIKGTLIPESFEYNEESETLYLKYFNP